MTDRLKSALWILVAATLGGAGAANAQVYHQYPGAPVVGDQEPAVGATFGFGEDLIRVLGYGRFNASDVADLGLEIVIDQFDPDPGDEGTRFGLAADFRYAIVPTDTELPFDLSLDGGFGFQTGADLTNINIPVGGVISRPLVLQNDRVIVPYGGLYLIYTHVSIDLPPGVGDASDNELDLELRLGASVEIGGGLSGFANVHIGEAEMFAIGLNSSL